jgi:hypothetical protein
MIESGSGNEGGSVRPYLAAAVGAEWGKNPRIFFVIRGY